MMGKYRHCKDLTSPTWLMLTHVIPLSLDKTLAASHEHYRESNEALKEPWQTMTADDSASSVADVLPFGLDPSQILCVWSYTRHQNSDGLSESSVTLPQLRNVITEQWVASQSNVPNERRAVLEHAISRACLQLILSSQTVLPLSNPSSGHFVEEEPVSTSTNIVEISSARMDETRDKPEGNEDIDSSIPQLAQSSPSANPEPGNLRSSGSAKTLLEQYTKVSWRDDTSRTRLSGILDQWVVGTNPQYFRWQGLPLKTGDTIPDSSPPKKKPARAKSPPTRAHNIVYGQLQSSQRQRSSQTVPIVRSSQAAPSQMPSQDYLSQGPPEVPTATGSKRLVLGGIRTEMPDRTFTEGKKKAKKPRPGFG